MTLPQFLVIFGPAAVTAVVGCMVWLSSRQST